MSNTPVKDLLKSRNLPELLKFQEIPRMLQGRLGETTKEILEILSYEEYGIRPWTPYPYLLLSMTVMSMPMQVRFGAAFHLSVEMEKGTFSFPCTYLYRRVFLVH